MCLVRAYRESRPKAGTVFERKTKSMAKSMAKKIPTMGPRQFWEQYADHVATGGRVTCSWYESDLRRLRLSYYPDTGEVRLYMHTQSSAWRIVDTASWRDASLTPKDIAHRARAVLYTEAQKRCKPISASDGVGNPVGHKCDGRLRTVRR